MEQSEKNLVKAKRQLHCIHPFQRSRSLLTPPKIILVKIFMDLIKTYGLSIIVLRVKDKNHDSKKNLVRRMILGLQSGKVKRAEKRNSTEKSSRQNTTKTVESLESM